MPTPKKPVGWKVEAIRAFKAIAFRLIDREHVGTFVVFCTLAIVAIVAVRIPSAALGEIPSGFTYLLRYSRSGVVALLAWALLMSVTASVVLVGLLKTMRATYQAEIKRMGEAKAELEKRVDPKRLPMEESRGQGFVRRRIARAQEAQQAEKPAESGADPLEEHTESAKSKGSN